jgi:hypothetical protein
LRFAAPLGRLPPAQPEPHCSLKEKTLKHLLTIVLLIVGLPFLAQAQTVDPGSLADLSPTVPGPYYGIAAESAVAASALAAVPLVSTYEWTWDDGRYFTTADSVADQSIHLPRGARITAFQMHACDTSPTGEVWAFLAANPNSTGMGTVLAYLGTGGVSSPGCTLFTLTLPLAQQVTVDNGQNNYYIEWKNTTLDGTTKVRGFRVFYSLQVSPAPLTASFSDVPTTHPFFRFVEALAAAGITGGCGGGNYCPDQPVTRGQMAVFLSAALGLHWPN